MQVRSVSIVAAFLLILVSRGSAVAGYVSTDLTSVQGARGEPLVSLSDEGAGAACADSETAEIPQRFASEANLLRIGSVGSVAAGGTSSESHTTAGYGGFGFAVPISACADCLPKVSWLAAEGRSVLPLPRGSGTFRPPRLIAR